MPRADQRSPDGSRVESAAEKAPSGAARNYTSHMKRLSHTLALLAAWSTASASWGSSPAAAEGPTLGQRTDHATEAVSSAAKSARERAAEAASSARERASGAAETAKEKTRAAAETLTSGAREAAERARELASSVAEGARHQVEDLGETVGGALETSKEAASSALQGVRNEARDVLRDMADALDGASRKARKELRRDHWEKLKARFSLGNKPSAAVSDELLDHEYRVARLERARELAREVEDERSVTKSERLLEAEYARHRQRLQQLRNDERKQAKR